MSEIIHYSREELELTPEQLNSADKPIDQMTEDEAAAAAQMIRAEDEEYYSNPYRSK